MAEVGSAFVSLVPSGRGFGGKAESALAPEIRGAGGSLGKTLAIGLAGGLATAGAAIGASIVKAGQLDSKMREVVTLFGETGPAAERSLGQVQTQVRDLSNEFGIAQETLTGGLYSAISAGIPKQNAFEFMQVASKAAIGGVTDVETAVDGISTTINAFGLEASEAQSVADSMFTAVKGGKTTFGELSDSLFNVAPAAAAAGVSFKEVNAGIAALTAGGTPTSVATTQLRAALTGLQKPSEDLNRVFQAAGFESAQLAIEQEGLGTALKIVKDASNGNNGELQKLLGSSEAVAAANVLAGTGAKKFADELQNQSKAAGAASDAFDVVNDGFDRQLEIFKTKSVNFGLSIGQAFLPLATSVLTFLNNDLRPAVDTFLAPLGQIKTAITTLFSGDDGAQGFAEILDNVFGNTGKYVEPLRTLGNTVLSVFEQGKQIVSDFAATFTGQIVPTFTSTAATIGAGLLPIITSLWTTIQTQVIPVVRSLAETFTTQVLPAVSGLVASFVANVLPTIQRFANLFLSTIVPALATFVQSIVTNVVPVVIRFAQVFVNQILPAVISVAGYFISNMLPILAKIYTIIATQVVPIIAKFAGFLISKIVPYVLKTAKTIGSNLKPILDTLFQVITGTILPALQKFLGRLREYQPTIQKVISIVVKIIGTLAKWASFILGKLLPPLIRLAGFLVGVLFAAIGTVIGIIVKIIAKVIEFGSKIVGAVKKVAEFVSGLKEKFGDAVSFVKGIPGKIVSAIGNLGGLLLGKGKELIQGLISGITSKIQAVKDAIGSVTDTIGRFLPGSPVKEGPLRSWNRGGAGKRLAGMLADGLASPDALRANRLAAESLAASIGGGVNVPRVRPLAGAGDRLTNSGGSRTFNIYETTDAAATAREVSRRESFAGG